MRRVLGWLGAVNISAVHLHICIHADPGTGGSAAGTLRKKQLESQEKVHKAKGVE